MKRTHLVLGGMLLLALFTFSSVGLAAEISIGYISWDLTESGSGAFDIVNNTGTFNDGADFVVATPITLSNLALHVEFVGGATQDFGSAYFTYIVNGSGFDGAFLPDITLPNTATLPTTATLTGTYSPLSVSLIDSSTGTILPNFSATIDYNSTGLAGGDFKIFYADFTPNATTVPEPSTLLLLGTGFASLVLLRRKKS